MEDARQEFRDEVQAAIDNGRLGELTDDQMRLILEAHCLRLKRVEAALSGANSGIGAPGFVDGLIDHANGTFQAETAFRRLAPSIGLSPDAYGKTIFLKGRPFTLTEVALNRPKFPVGGVDAQGRKFKFTTMTVLRALDAVSGPGKAPAAKRTEAEILEDYRRVINDLSPENISWDGERSRSQVAVAERALLAKQRALVAELGRHPTDAEVYLDGR